MTTVLRPYQIDAVTQVRRHAASGGSGAILHMPTGSGKTACFSDVLKGAWAKGKCALMIVRGKALVHQASERLTREGVPHGIYQGQNSVSTHERILVCSVDTLYARRVAPRADLIVIDECHLSHSEGYQWLLSQYPGVFKLGVSATPHHRQGMRHIGDRLIRPVSITDLIREGYLVGGRYFVPYVPNLRGVKKTGGDYNTKELGKRSADDEELTGNAARIWSTHLRGKSTIAYGVNLQHCAVLAEAFRREGARVETIVANTKDGVRRDYIRRLENGEIDILCSVGVLTTGVDIPSLRAILCCRPSESYNLWVQILGRCTRPFPGKTHFLVYDLSGNLLRHGPIESEQIASLDGISSDPGEKISVKTCPECYATFAAGPESCPECGASLVDTKARKVGKRIHGLTEKDEVHEYKVEPWEIDLPVLVAKAKEKGWRKGAVYHTLKAKYGDEAANAAWPRIRAMKKWPVKTKAGDPVTTPSSSIKSWFAADPEPIAGYGKIPPGSLSRSTRGAS